MAVNAIKPSGSDDEVLLNSGADFSFPLAYIGTDNKLGGIRVAEKMAELSGAKGKFYCNSTSPDVSSNNDRYLGFKEGLSKFPNMEFVGVDYN